MSVQGSAEVRIVEADGPSKWQQAIEGEWFGAPSVFDADGNHTGFIQVNRSSVFEDGETTYYMHTLFDNAGPLRNRFETVEFAFGVEDGDQDRIYLGPDFYGAGHPYAGHELGSLVDAHYYSPAWRADLRTMVHLPDAETEIYSSQLFDGPTLIAVFNGVYKVAFDYEENELTRERIDAFTDGERHAGRRVFGLPSKQSGTWSGDLAVFGPDQEPTGTAHLTVTHEPLSLLRARQTYEFTGAFERRWVIERYRDDNRHSFEGPDLYGNAIAYGRAAYSSLHVTGQAEKVVGRDFLFDDQLSWSLNWKVFRSDHRVDTLFGVLDWEPS